MQVISTHIGLAITDPDESENLEKILKNKFGDKIKVLLLNIGTDSDFLIRESDMIVWDMKGIASVKLTRLPVTEEIPVILYISGETTRDLHSAIKLRPFDIWLKEQTSGDEIVNSIRRLQEWLSWRREAHQFKKAIEVSPVSLLISDAKGSIIYVNPQFEKVSGYSASELLGKNPRMLKSGKHTDQFYKEMWKVISSGEIWKGEICNRSKEGKFYTERQMIVPAINKRKEITHFIGLRIDDTDRKRAEEALRKAEALKNIKELAGGIAHEFSQPLQVLTISMSMLELQVKGDELFERCQRMIQRIIDLVSSLKNITELKQQDYLQTKILDLRKSSEQKNKIETTEEVKPDSSPEAT